MELTISIKVIMGRAHGAPGPCECVLLLQSRLGSFERAVERKRPRQNRKGEENARKAVGVLGVEYRIRLRVTSEYFREVGEWRTYCCTGEVIVRKPAQIFNTCLPSCWMSAPGRQGGADLLISVRTFSCD